MQDLPAPASMLHFGTVPFPLRLLHLDPWIPAFAAKAPLALDKRARGKDGGGSSLDMKKPP